MPECDKKKDFEKVRTAAASYCAKALTYAENSISQQYVDVGKVAELITAVFGEDLKAKRI